VLSTNTTLPASDVAKTYKAFWTVERTFREEKSTLEVRPIYHHRDKTRYRSYRGKLPWPSGCRWISFIADKCPLSKNLIFQTVKFQLKRKDKDFFGAHYEGVKLSLNFCSLECDFDCREKS